MQNQQRTRSTDTDRPGNKTEVGNDRYSLRDVLESCAEFRSCWRVGSFKFTVAYSHSASRVNLRPEKFSAPMYLRKEAARLKEHFRSVGRLQDLLTTDFRSDTTLWCRRLPPPST